MASDAFIKPEQRAQFDRQQLEPIAYALPLKWRRIALDAYTKMTEANLAAKTESMLKQEG